MRLLQDLSVSGRFTIPGQVDIFLFQVFPDIVHPGLPLSPSAYFFSLFYTTHFDFTTAQIVINCTLKYALSATLVIQSFTQSCDTS